MALPPSLLRRILGPSLVAGLAIAVIACESKSSTSTGPSPIKCLVSLAPPSDSIEPAGGKAAVTVSAQPECSWTASSDATWITGLSPASGQGNGQIEFQAAANPAGTMRQGHIAVNDQQIPVQQRPSPCRFEVSPAALSIDADGGTVAITVTTLAGCGWQASADAGWVAIGSSSGTGSGSVSLRVASNGGETRNATILVAGQTVALTQTSTTSPTPGAPGGPAGPGGPSNCVFSLDRASVAVPAAGGSVTVAVSGAAGCARTATSQAPWITIVGGGSGTASGAVTFSVSPNAGAGRTGTLTIAGHAFTVIQSAAAAPNCSYSIAPAQQSIGAAGGAGASISISTSNGCAWTAASQASWISVSSSAGGSGPGTVTFTVAANSGGARTGSLAIAGQTATVSQDAAASSSCTFSISPGNHSIGAAGGGGSVAVSTAAGCTWTAASQTSWISVSSSSAGSGPGTVTFTVAANSSGARTGTLAIAGQTATVSQEAAASIGCTFSISPGSQSIGAAGGGGSVAVSTAAGCTWNARSNDGWISLTSGANGNGAGSVAFNVAANSSSARSGTLTIAGETFTVNQASGSCSYSISPTEQAIDEKGASLSVAVSAGAGCGWTATSHESWISITEGASGSGNGTVRFTVESTGGKQRIGTLTIAGRTFTVDQHKKNDE